MNATDILTEILRGGLGGGTSKPSSGGGGGGIFRDIFGGGASPVGRTVPPPPSERDIEQQARDLEDMLGVGREKTAAPPRREPAASPPARTTTSPPPVPADRDAEAEVLLRAMIQAAKADGRLTRDEQGAILDKLGGASRESVDFLRSEMQAATDVRDFAWSVPIGMEYKVYAVSLTAIDLDSQAESDYLRQLGHGLRLPLEVRSHIHQRYGVPAPTH